MIDIFNHFMPKAYLDRLGAFVPGHVALTAFPRVRTLCDIDARLSLLDEFDGLQHALRMTRSPRSAASTRTGFQPSSPPCR